MRYSTEDANDHDRKNERAKYRLHEDGVLDLAEGRLLDPNFAVEYLADDVALFVLGNPRLVLIAVRTVGSQGLLRESTLAVNGVMVIGK